MSANDHRRWSEDLAAYALGAMEPGEAAALERHLDGCGRCREELRWLIPAVQSLAEAVERQEPPPRLRESLMAEVRADTSRAPVTSRRRILRPAMGFAVAALLIAAAVGYEVGGDGSDGGSTTIFSRQAGGIAVKMVREGDGGTLKLAHVRQTAPGKVLEAWVRRDGEVEPVPALFVPDRQGRASTTITDMSGVDTVMVTEEPQGGSRQPTSEPIVTMSVPQ
ncbi:MAG: anti-sigma factor domain-containing protein [Solirubrobacterales bacterium]